MADLFGGKYILEGHRPILCQSTYEWGRWYETANRSVARTKIGDSDVSTVFLGLDHAFGGHVPILFETMVFGGQLDQEQERYPTWDEAEAGHAAMVQRVKDAPP